MMTLEEQFRSRVSAFLESTGISATRFGRMVLGDSGLMHRIASGRSLTLRTADRILAFIAKYDRESGGARDPPLRSRNREPSKEPRRTKKSKATTDQPRNERTIAPTRILRLPEVMARTGLSRSTIYAWRVAGRFPQAVPLATRCVGWIESEVEAWLRERIAERGGGLGIVAY